MPTKLETSEAEVRKLIEQVEKEQRRKERHSKLTRKGQRARARLKRLKVRLREALERFRRRKRKARKGGRGAVRWATSQEGITEKPDNSNWGHPVQDWIVRTGYSSPVPWCGCFAHEAVVEKGKAKIPYGIRLGYHGYIIDDARNGRNGLKAVAFSEAKPGDIVAFSFGHIGVVRDKPSGSSLPTIEGNTSPTDAGSQYNGGCVAARVRPSSQVAVIARPDY